MKTIKQPGYKQHMPLLFLVLISSFWAFYYNSSNSLNDYGEAKYEWLFMLDGLLVLPILCLFCVADKKAAMIKAVVYVCLAILIGSFIIPAENKVIWPYLENGRYLILAVMILFELSVIVTVFWAIRSGLKQASDPDDAITVPIQNWLGQGVVAKIMCVEARMWSFLLFYKRIKPTNYPGAKHFSYHFKDGAHSNALGFIWLIAFELPLVHLLLHFMWSPFAANVITGLTLFGLCFMLAEYRAMSRRPISILNDQLIIRMGLLNVYTININDIESVHEHHVYVARGRGIKRLNLAGNPNLCVLLNKKINGIERVYLGVDHPTELLKTLN